ncbi:hypothetical protein FQN60_007154, partial [Etheostoma spectabile]
MTGLDIEKDQIIEMACIITDSDLNILAEGPNLIIKQPAELLDGMSDWCKEHHGKLCAGCVGNSVHADKRFLDKYMPQFMYHLHYRIIDVSTIKELCRPVPHIFSPLSSTLRWFPEEYKMVPNKKAAHRALDDIQESIKELQFYRANVFKASTEEKKRKIVENGGSNNRDELEEAVEEEDKQPPIERDGGESRKGAAWRAVLTDQMSALHEAPLDHDYFSPVNNLKCACNGDGEHQPQQLANLRQGSGPLIYHEHIQQLSWRHAKQGICTNDLQFISQSLFIKQW